MKNYLGIDWGESKIGLAFADGETKIAFSYTTFKNDRNLVNNIAKAINDKEVSVVVIGISENLKYEKKFKNEKELGRKLETMTGVEVKYQSEMFSTKMAERNLIERGAKKIKRFDDQESAKIILQEWLDNN
ncbi:MAG: Holliday junction resolvase RuvX [Candidatus Moranbacteria bacterium]|nr:Holliday junction resolvase RuvX [Candidatus Moranbacteria bacterium]